MNNSRTLLSVAVLLLSGVPTSAEIITFEGFSTGVFTTGVEGSFSLAAANASVVELNASSSGAVDDPGNQSLILDIAGPPTILAIVRNDLLNGLFQLTSLEFLASLSTSVNIEGFFGGASVGTESFTPATGTAFVAQSPSGPLSGTDIDKLTINLGTLGSGQYSAIDDIDLFIVAGTSGATVPEPSSVAFLLAGGVGFWTLRRRKNSVS